MPKLFGTSGIRGPADSLFTKDFCQKIGLVFGTWLKSKGKNGPVALAYDPRQSSPRIKDGLIQGLSAAGFSALDQGVIPTPALTYFLKNSPHVSGAVMITGSHINADLNGVKLMFDGEEVTKLHELEIEKLFSDSRLKTDNSIPDVKYDSSAKELYLNLLKSLSHPPYPNWKIVLDTSNGAQTGIIRDLFLDLKLDFTCTNYCDIQSPFFSGKDTEKVSDYADLSRQVLLAHADFGIGFDVDGDRVIFVDEKGQFIPGDYTCALLARDSSSPAIVTPISTSSVIDHIGKKVFRTPVGSTHVAAKMKEVGSTFGFEANGGAISSEIHFGRDGAVTMVKLLNYLIKSSSPLSQAVDSLPHFEIFRDKIDCPFDKYSSIYSAAQEKYHASRIDTTDGVKIYLSPQQWLLFRGSGNAPEFRVFAESPDPNSARKLGHEGLNLARSIIHPVHSQPVRRDDSPPLDSLGVLDSIKQFPDQCRQVLHEIAQKAIPPQCFLVQNVVVSGMGGSALGGRIISCLDRQTLKVPIVVSTQYHLPNFVNEKTLVILSSYSGNTEETLSSLAEARARGSQMFIISAGGKLGEIAKQFDIPAYIFDPVHNPSTQPRLGLGYNILSVLYLLSRCQLITAEEPLDSLPQFLTSRQGESFSQMEQVAQRLHNRLPILVSAEHLIGAAHAAKNMLNENSKTMSAAFDLPELNHHLLEGLAHPSSNASHLAFLFIISKNYHPEVIKRIEPTQEIIGKNHIPVLSWSPSAPTRLFEVMDFVQASAYLSYSLSQTYGVDPGPIPWVDWMKDKLK
ncbi:hypothetical protein A2876_00005 [Candidatus Amesbacteria bacterium RIFCSPHIGHO2_01_FULL_48_32b]|uniref:SIS domain-containing protein n=1 Tax=Candidatus Amesbacteria bacterium RIFCSPHIGHO2_01_FULL_48_32b TaxID=1797253 RepID=A0A1F4YFE8_9BACT|nr:MAG: hypothetical protein A2876_00005 [Candidatus Amesbacteria bacterium RIFCSPHIGHO2_01_FULL_48_32b]